MNKKQPKNLTNLGLDLGYGNIKLFGRAGSIVLPSHVAASQGHVLSHLGGLAADDRPLAITVDDQPYYVGSGAHRWGRPIENLDYERLTGSPEIRALLYGSLTQYMASAEITSSLCLYVGLPLEPLSAAEADVQATVAAIRKWLLGVHIWQSPAGDHRVNIERVEVTSQPAGAYFDYILDDNGRPHPARAGQLQNEIGVVSIGFNTVERMVIQSGRPVQKFTAGSTAGVRRLLERINEQSDNLYSLGELDDLLRAGGLDTRHAIDDWARQVGGELERSWGTSWRRFAHVVLVGGGAVLLNGRLLPKFAGRASVPDQPVMAIARGLYKLSLAQGQRV